jgi:DNA-binding transcriptional LysR family regulator
MEIRFLQYFVAATELGSFTAAAESLHVTQPSLSEGIRRLEADVDSPLFHRVGKGVVLTEPGLVLLPRARHILQEMTEAGEAMIALRGLRGGRVRVAAPPGLTVDPLAHLIGDFRRAHPEVVIALFAAEDGSIATQAVLSGRCELALVDRPVTAPDLVAHALTVAQLMVVSPPGSAPGGPIALEELSGRPFISGFPGTRTRALLDHAHDLGIDLPVVVETPHREAIVPLILENVGSAFLTESVARDAAQRGAVVRALNPPNTYDVHLVHRAKPLTRAAEAFVARAVARTVTTDRP